MKSAIIQRDIEALVEEYRPFLKTLEAKTVLVTGANGMIPSYLVDTIALYNKETDHPCNLVLYNKNPTSKESRLSHLLDNKQIMFVTQDVGKSFSVQGNPQIIIHGASPASVSSLKKYPLQTIDANVQGTRTLLEYANKHPVESFLFLSSSEVYGNPPTEEIPTSEQYFGNVNSLGDMACYAEGKRFSETLCSAFFREGNVPVKIARIFHTYGPGIRNDGKTLANLFTQGIEQGKISLNGVGAARRSWSYISDTTRGLFDVLSKGISGEAYNVGDDTNNVSIKELAWMVKDSLELPSGVTILPYTSSGESIQDRMPNIEKLRGLGFEPKIDLREGLNRTRDHILETR